MQIVVADTHTLVRKGIVAILSENSKMEIIEATSINESLNAIKNKKVDVVIVDLKLNNEDGLEVVIQGKNIDPQTKYIILTSCISRRDFLRAEKLEVDGYILKETTPKDMLFIIDLIARGKKYYDSDIIKYYKKSIDKNNQINQLTDREKDVLSELSKGLSNQEIAEKLYVSLNTVKKHISSILFKLNLKHRTQAAVFVQNMDNMGYGA